MKRLILLLGLILVYITSNAQYYRYEHYHICEPYVDRVYHVAPVHMKVRKSPRVIVVEEEENVIYYHKKKEIQGYKHGGKTNAFSTSKMHQLRRQSAN